MATSKLTIQHGNTIYEPPVKDEVKLEWDCSGSPGKLTFTVLKVDGLVFEEGDTVCFYYNNKNIFKGYVFKKKRNREHHIEVTCYDQLRYFKNKYTYVFEKKTATQIIQSLCKDFNLVIGKFDNTKYVIPSIVEENITAIDVVKSVLDDTLLNTSNMFIFYDDFGKLTLKNANNMVSTTLIYEQSAEDFDYTSSIDGETYNSIVLYYKNDDNSMKVYNAYSPSKIQEWGLLRYFEEVKTPSLGKNKANNLLNLYCRETRELKVTGAFGDITVRGGTLIPVKLNLGDIKTNNYMLVEKVVHYFKDNQHTMDLTLEGAYKQDDYTVGYNEAGEVKPKSDTSTKTKYNSVGSGSTSSNPTSSGSTTTTKTSGNANADYIFKTLVENGASVAGACGVLGNIESESNFNPCVVGDNGTSYGICQWHNERWTNLKKWGLSYGLSYVTLQTQVLFLIHELKTQYKQLWNQICTASGQSGASDAAFAMCVHFERPKNPIQSSTKRCVQAKKWFGIYGG